MRMLIVLLFKLFCRYKSVFFFFLKIGAGNAVQGRPSAKASASLTEVSDVGKGRKRLLRTASALPGALPCWPIQSRGYVAPPTAPRGPRAPPAVGPLLPGRQAGKWSCRGHGWRSSPGGGAAAAAGGAERVRGELLPDAGGGDGVAGLEPGPAGPRGGGGGRGEGRGVLPGALSLRSPWRRARPRVCRAVGGAGSGLQRPTPPGCSHPSPGCAPLRNLALRSRGIAAGAERSG